MGIGNPFHRATNRRAFFYLRLDVLFVTTTEEQENIMKHGKVIALYGINNLGKSTQREMLVDALRRHGFQAYGYKYAHYTVLPSGPILNDYLRNGNPYHLTAREFQTLQVMNRMQFEPTLIKHKDHGDVVVLEDYTGTGIAWGIGAGVDEQYLRMINSHLLVEDHAILLDGGRFFGGVERGHLHESNNTLTDQVREVHLRLARELGWKVVAANQSKEDVHKEIIACVMSWI